MTQPNRNALPVVLATAALGAGLFCFSRGYALWNRGGDLSDTVFLAFWGPVIVVAQGLIAALTLTTWRGSRIAATLALAALLITVPPVMGIWNGLL